ncbi:MAG: 3-hydroxyacyl-CoA dehydrogenase NAD-binding domain-containing protein [Lachnospiraceae bacterium]
MKVGVIGAGTMGSGIAQAFVMTDGYEVCLCDIKTEYAEGGKAKIQKNMDFLVSKEKIAKEKADEIMGRISTGLNGICTDCDLIIEVALEKLEIKQSIFKELMGIVKKDCMFASNTSSLSITKIGEGLDRPMIGMHFFNPADRMKLVEVIKGENTPQEMVDKIKEISVEIGKTPVEVKEAPGFVVNRILIPMINEAIGVFAAGTASAEDIDIAMQLGASHPMGPLHLGDLVGLDICLAIMEVLYTETKDEKYAPQPLLKKMVEEKKLGRKTGIGFFDYSK